MPWMLFVLPALAVLRLFVHSTVLDTALVVGLLLLAAHAGRDIYRKYRNT